MGCLIDITTAITFISDITNTILSAEVTQRDSIKRQILEEQHEPTLNKLINEMKKYKLIMSKNILSKTQNLVDVLGTYTEKDRFAEFIKNVQIIDDVPTINLEIGFKLLDHEKSLIYAAHYHGYHILTGNATLIKKISNEDGDLNIHVILHSSRSLFGNRHEFIK